MEVFRPQLVSPSEMTRFHSADYINSLRIITPDNMHEYLRQLQRCRVLRSCLPLPLTPTPHRGSDRPRQRVVL